MVPGNFIFYNGKISKAGKPIIMADNRSFRYGDGFFETIKLINGRIPLAEFHFERLFASLERMQFQRPVYFTPLYLEEQVKLLARKNYHHKMARVRLTIFRGEGGLYDTDNHFPHHLIQTWELNPANNSLNENGLVTDIYPDARKVCDGFSSIKSNNYLPYAMAALWAKKLQLNDAILLNPYERAADATIANIFVVKDGLIKTPALSEGPVAGVMRKFLLQSLRKENIPVEETAVRTDDIFQAQEIFLTNGIYGIRWVKQCGANLYGKQVATDLYKRLIKPLW